ncbi:YbdD/YjiX family protein [Mycolicibacterium sp. XJ1819]
MGRVGRITRQIGSYVGKLKWYSATLMGDNHYRRYVEHRERMHPGQPVISEREYWRMRHAATEANPNARCC